MPRCWRTNSLWAGKTCEQLGRARDAKGWYRAAVDGPPAGAGAADGRAEDVKSALSAQDAGSKAEAENLLGKLSSGWF